jgi:hypothetical protein
MHEQLTRAVDLRIESEEEFKKQLVLSLRELIKTLAECDPSNARTTLDLTQDQLRKIILKLNDKHAISSTEAQTIANTLKESNLFRGPTLPQAPPPSALPPPPASLTTPAPPPSALPQPPASLQSPTLPPLPPGPPALPPSPPAPPGSASTVPPVPQAKTPARLLGTRTRLDPISGGRRTRRKRKTRR